MFGDRTAWFTGNICVDYPQFKIKATVKMEKAPKDGKYALKNRKDLFSGMIYNYNPDKSRKINIPKYDNVSDCFDGKKDFVSQISKISGSYLEGCDFDDKPYWDIRKDLSYKQFYEENPLPSDYRWREDLNWLYWKDKPIAEAWKLELERVQRNDRNKRTEYIKKNKIKAAKHTI